VIIEFGDQADKENARAPQFITGPNPMTPTVAVAWIGDLGKIFQPIGGIFWQNEGMKMLCMTRMIDRQKPSNEREAAILATIHDALARKYLLEPSKGKRTSSRTVIYPEGAKGLQAVLFARDIRADSRSDVWEACKETFGDIAYWGHPQ
jgi:hypothetical protein